MQDDPGYVRQAFAAGASGVRTEGCRRHGSGGRYPRLSRPGTIPPSGVGRQHVAAETTERKQPTRQTHYPTATTSRLCGCWRSGTRTRRSRSMFYISVRTAETHRAHIMRKLNSRLRAELVRYALDHGGLSLRPGAASARRRRGRAARCRAAERRSARRLAARARPTARRRPLRPDPRDANLADRAVRDRERHVDAACVLVRGEPPPPSRLSRNALRESRSPRGPHVRDFADAGTGTQNAQLRSTNAAQTFAAAAARTQGRHGGPVRTLPALASATRAEPAGVS